MRDLTFTEFRRRRETCPNPNCAGHVTYYLDPQDNIATPRGIHCDANHALTPREEKVLKEAHQARRSFALSAEAACALSEWSQATLRVFNRPGPD